MKKGKLIYRFVAQGWTRWDCSPYTPEDGTLVKKCQPFGCPKNGTMGHTYICDASTGKFIGLVTLESLSRL